MPEAIHQWAATHGVRLGSSVLLVLVLACAKTSLTSIVNPPWRTTELRRVVVFFETDDPGVRRSFEENFGQRAEIPSVDFIASYTLSPGHPIDWNGFAREAREMGVDALLTFTQAESDDYEPRNRVLDSPGCSDFVRPFDGCGASAVGPELLWASYTVTLVDPTDAVTFWTAQATSEESDFTTSATWEDLRNSLIDKTIQQLRRDGVFSR